jgi:hypothetical protein
MSNRTNFTHHEASRRSYQSRTQIGTLVSFQHSSGLPQLGALCLASASHNLDPPFGKIFYNRKMNFINFMKNSDKV